MALTLTQREADGTLVITGTGRIVLGNETSTLRDRVKEALQQKHQQIVLNLAGVEFIDSSGLGTLVGLYTTARAQGAQIRLANLSKRFHELLQITKLLTVFDVFDSEKAAIDSFRD